MTNVSIKISELFADSARGIYIPQHFAESYATEKWKYIDADDIQILLVGPNHQFYWDAWDSVLNNAETICGGVLHQDGDLWVVWPQLAIDAVNEYCSDALEYEESHIDAGNNYAHLVQDSWDEQKTRDLIKNLIGPDVQDLTKDYFDVDRWIPKWEVDPMGLDKDIIADIAIDLFEMKRGSIYGPFADGVVLDAFAIGEIEVDLSDLGVDDIMWDMIRESCDAYISGNGSAYLGTDSVWFAVVDPVALQSAIADHVAAFGKES